MSEQIDNRNEHQLHPNSPGNDEYFSHRRELLPSFWRRLGGEPDWCGKSILEVGCGYGEMTFDIGRKGAGRAVGVDINEERIEKARQRLRDDAELADRNNVAFICCDCRNLPAEEKFDVIVSRDSIEHIMDLEDMFNDLALRLKPGGRLYIGAGPLYRSPYGGHRRMHMLIPWGHLILPEPLLIRWANLFRSEEKKVNSVPEMGLNKVSLAECTRIFTGLGLRTVHWQVNHGDNFISRIFRILTRCAWLREYFAHDIYVALEKPGGAG